MIKTINQMHGTLYLSFSSINQSLFLPSAFLFRHHFKTVKMKLETSCKIKRHVIFDHALYMNEMKRLSYC